MNDAQYVVDALKEKHWRITFAESCTGGLLAGALVDVADASKVFDGAFVTYADEAKTSLVDVAKQTIETYGVVSSQVAVEMARGAARVMDAQVAVGVSGIAGPTGGTEETPVGTVCFGFYVDGAVYADTCHFPPEGRNQVRQACVAFAMARLKELL